MHAVLDWHLYPVTSSVVARVDAERTTMKLSFCLKSNSQYTFKLECVLFTSYTQTE